MTLPSFGRLVSAAFIYATSVMAQSGLVRADSEVLTIITKGQTTQLDRDSLMAMGPVSFTTTTPWTEGAQEFSGIPLRRLLPDLQDDELLLLSAINDYTVTMPGSGVDADFPVVAVERNGAPMSLRDKGPYWLVFDFDRGPEYQTETVYSRSIWQLVRIEVKSN